MTEATRTIAALTGLRFFAAAAIVLWHSQTGYFFPPNAFSPFVLAGAVPLFFVLSGFVLTVNRAKYRSWPDFLAARIGRIWPAHIAAIGFLLLIFAPYSGQLLHGQANLTRLVLNGALLQAWSPSIATYWSLNGPSWSVSCELFFYLVFPWCVDWFERPMTWRVPAVFALAVLAVWAACRASPALDPNWLATVNPLVNLPIFLLGIAAGHRTLRSGPSAAGAIRATTIQILALAAAVAGNAGCALIGGANLPAASQFQLQTAGPTPFYAALLIALARYDGAVSRLLSVGAIVYLGEISYSIYLFHQLIIRWHSVHLSTFSAVPMPVQYAAVWAVTIGVAALSHRFIERPGRRWVVAAWSSLRPKSPIVMAGQPTAAADTASGARDQRNR